MQKPKSPLMQVWSERGPRARSSGDSAEASGCPQLSAPQQTPGTRREQPGVPGVPPAPGTATSAELRGLSRSQPERGPRRNPRAALPGARPGHLQGTEDVSSVCV